MKKITALLCLGLAGLLSSCGIYDLVHGEGIIIPTGGAATVLKDPLKKKTVAVYDLKKYVSEKTASSALETYKMTDFEVFYPEDKEEVLYVTFENYCNLLARYFGSGFNSTVSGNNASVQWSVKKGSSLVYQVTASLASAAFSIGGSLYGTDAMTPDYGKSSLVLDMQTSSNAIETGSVYVNHSFKDYRTPIYLNNNVYYFPMALLEQEIGKEFGSFHFHDFTRLYRYDSYAQLGEKFTLSGTEMSAQTGIVSYVSEHKAMPAGLRQLDADGIYYVFQNQYGLLAQRGYASGKAALDSIGAYDRLLSSDTLVRQKALYESFAVFDDDHTGVYAAHGEMWGETRDGYVRGPHSVKRSQERTRLNDSRSAWLDTLGKKPDDVLYHEDMAYFSFDSFSFTRNAYEEDGKTRREDLYIDDSYFYALHQLQEIDAHQGIKKVVVDISLNGGGTVGVMYKLLALLSPNNSSRIGFNNSATGQKYTVTARADVNQNGQYEDNETYGGKYQFFVLTSDGSFSCGNAFPFLLRKQGHATIIGKNSGGGECTVDSSFLPSGHGIVFSGKNHIGYYPQNSSNFFGDEGGAGVDIDLSLDSFYNLTSLYTAINQ